MEVRLCLPQTWAKAVDFTMPQLNFVNMVYDERMKVHGLCVCARLGQIRKGQSTFAAISFHLAIKYGSVTHVGVATRAACRHKCLAASNS